MRSTSSRGPATRSIWSAARPGTPPAEAGRACTPATSRARYALWKNPDRLTDRQQAKLAWVAKVNHRLYRAYLLKEQLREVFVPKGEEGKVLLTAG